MTTCLSSTIAESGKNRKSKGAESYRDLHPRNKMVTKRKAGMGWRMPIEQEERSLRGGGRRGFVGETWVVRLEG